MSTAWPIPGKSQQLGKWSVRTKNIWIDTLSLKRTLLRNILLGELGVKGRKGKIPNVAETLRTPTPAEDQAGSHGWTATERFVIPQKSDGNGCCVLSTGRRSPRKSRALRRAPDWRRRSCETEFPPLPASRSKPAGWYDIAWRTRFLKGALFVHQACRPRAEINTKCPKWNLRVTDPHAVCHNQLCLCCIYF